MSRHSLALATRRSLGWTAPVLASLLLLTAFVSDSRGHRLASDFQIGLVSARQLVHGLPIYGPHALVYYVYPPLYAESLTPFLLVPAGVAEWVAALLSVALLVAGLWLIGVRDVRVVAVALLSPPVVHGCEVANVTFVMFVLLALAWRRFPLGVGLAVALKFVAWPFLVWQAAARGIRSAVASGLLAAGLVLASWVVIGFTGLRGYPSFLDSVAAGQEKLGYSVTGAFAGGKWVAIALTLAALIRCWTRTRHGDPIGGLAYAVAAMLVATPYVYDNYFVFVFIPLALRRPKFSPAWFLPLLLWINGGSPALSLDHKALGWIVIGGLIIWLGEGAPVRRITRQRSQEPQPLMQSQRPTTEGDQE